MKNKGTETEFKLFKLQLSLGDTVFVVANDIKGAMDYYKPHEVLSIEEYLEDIYLSQQVIDEVKYFTP